VNGSADAVTQTMDKVAVKVKLFKIMPNRLVDFSPVHSGRVLAATPGVSEVI